MAEFSIGSGLLATAVTILIGSLAIFVAARIVLDKASFLAALVSALVGSFASGLVLLLVSPHVAAWVALVLGLATWALALAIFFRTSWLKGAVVGLVAGLLWMGIQWLMARFL